MKQRFDHLDGLRGLAAVNVILGHGLLAFNFALYSGIDLHAHGTWEAALSAFPLLMPLAGQNFSVCVFLVLSGIVLAHALTHTRMSAAALVAKRFTRLGIPIFTAAMFAWALLAGGLVCNHAAVPLTRSPWLGAQMTHGAHLLDALQEGAFGSLLGPWSFATTYDSSLWTMPIEFAGSLLLIGTIKLRGWFGSAGQSPLLSAAVFCLLAIALYPTYLALIAVGAAVYFLNPGPLIERYKLGPLWPLGLVSLALLCGTVPYSAARGHVWDTLVGLMPGKGFDLPRYRLGAGAYTMDATSVWHGLGAVLLLVGVESSPCLRRLLSGKVPQYLGTISFPLYLIHVPVLVSVGCGAFLLADAAGWSYGAAVGVALALYASVAVCLAGLAVPFVERPAVLAASRVAQAVENAIAQIRATARWSAPPGAQSEAKRSADLEPVPIDVDRNML